MIRALLREAALRLPGVYFLAASADDRPALPPLHESAFVGFAPYGPLDRPIPVDSAAAYAALFGGDLALARDADGGRINAHLRSAVLGFLANGGRRAHVIRVAGPQKQTAAYTLRGLQAFTPGPAGTRLTPQAVRIEAAWPGAWANTLQFALQLEERSLPPAAFRVAASNTLLWQAGPAPQAVVVGDLLRIVFTDGRSRLFPVAAIDLAASAVTLRADCITATRLRRGQLLSTRLPPARPHRVDRLRLIPWWRDAGEARRSPLELAFNAGGPGYWADALPLASSRAADAGWIAETLTATARPRPAGRAEEFVAAFCAGLFRRLAGDEQFDWNPDGIAERALLGARFAPFPAVDEKPDSAPTHTPAPLFLPDALSPWSPADDDWIDADRPGGDDLAERGANSSRIFLDADLNLALPHLPDPLLATAWQWQYVDGRRLRGAHAFFGVASAGLLAAPDAVQPDWAPAPEVLAIDGFAPAGGPLRGGTTLTVSGRGFVRDRTHLRLGGRPIERLRVIDAQTLICRTPAGAAPGFAALEIRIGGASPENRPTRLEPGFAYRALPTASDFSACAGPPQIDRISPALGAAAGGGTVRLRGRRFVDPLAVRFGDLPARSLRRVSERLIVCVAPALPAGQAVDVTVETAGGRAVCTGAFWPRDNRPATDALPLVGDPRDFSTDALLAVQRELLVICAARADAVAILSLPRHFRRRDCIAWRSALAERLGALAGDDALAGREDVSVDSYGAVYHPWLTVAAAGKLCAVPPDGAACGIIAARELARQVWIAPARVALIGAVGLDQQLADDEAADLASRQFNLLRAEAGEILPITAHTLDAGRRLNQLSVRRLLILLRKWLLERGAEFVFATHDERFREAVKVELDQLLGRLYALGAFAGSTPATAFRVTTDASVNPPASVDAGRFVAIVQVAPSQPGEFILIRLERSGAGELRLSGA